MPATSSAPGSQPQSVARRNARTQRRQILDAVQQAEQIGTAATGVARSIRRGSRAVETATLVASGASPAQVARAPGTSAAVRREAQRAAAKAQRLRKVARAKQRTVKRAIKQDPPKAEKLVQKSTKRIWERLEVKGKGPAPKIELGQRTKAVTSHRPTVQVSKQDAKRFFSPAPKVRKTTRRTVVKEAVKAQTKAPTRQEKRQAATQLKQAAKKAQPGLAKKLDRGFGPNETISPRETAIVAEAHGLPGRTYAKAIAPGESGHRPGVPNPDDATPSLFQITPSVQSAETRSKFDRIAARHPGGYSNPIVAAKQARVLAQGSSDAGVSNYVAFDPSAPQGHLPGGQAAARRKLYGNPKPIPKKVKQEAKETLGPQRTKKIIKKARTPESPAPPAAPKKKPGPYEGTQKVIKEVIGPFAKTEDWKDKEDRGDPGGTLHDVGTLDGYAADLPVNEKIVDRIAKQLGLDPKIVNYGTRGLESVRSPKYPGYEFEFLPYDHGSGPHIHIGVQWTGTTGSTTAPSLSTGGSLVSTGAVAATPSGGQALITDQAISRDKSRRRRGKAKRMEGRQRSRLLRQLIAEGPPPAERVVRAPSYTPTERTKVTVEL